MTAAGDDAHWTLAPQPASIREARDRVGATLADCPCRDDVELVVSELVTNAIEHGTGMVDVDVAVLPATVRLVVTSGAGTDEPHVKAASDEDTGGRGLAIMAALTTGWGWERHEDRLSVWAEFDRPAGGTYARGAHD